MIEINNIGTVGIFNRLTGEKLIETEVSNVETQELESEEFKSFNWNPSATLTMSNTEISPELLNLFTVSDKPEYLNLEGTGIKKILVQARKHKAKRINKKWLKRYGYKEIEVSVRFKMNNCVFNEETGELDVYGINGKLVEYIEGQ